VLARRTEQRVDLPGHGRRAQPGDQLILRQRAFGEEGLHQLFVNFGDHLNELLARVLRGVSE